ncbi:MAG: metallophosphoesterase [Leptospiraceae bacterium]|nr:metallophosphoesterase [Leptospiraceae bacterium]MCP5496478.1 metallophosphoesterase [Leptospiraceae bacterium]
MKIVHISDLHIPVRIPIYQLRGKMFTGYLNYTVLRSGKHPVKIRESLFEHIRSMDYDCLIVSGDITNLSHKKEFLETKKLLSSILDNRTFMVPGNHDRYTTSSLKPKDLFVETFGDYLGTPISNDGNFYLYEKNIHGKAIIGWDSNRPTPIAIASGYVEPKVVSKTMDFLKKRNIQNYFLVCHHPIWNPPGKIETEHHKLLNRDYILRELSQNPPLVYFHGHSHDNWLHRLEASGTMVVNSASSTRISDKKHVCGFYTCDIKGDKVSFCRFAYNEDLEKFEESILIEYN